MNYSPSNVNGKVDAEVSQIADAAYNDNGDSLYDSIVLTEKDADTVSDLITEALGRLVRATQDIATPSGTGITFDVPDMPSGSSAAVSAQIDRYAVCFAVAGILQQRLPSAAPQYAERAAAALDNAISMLRTVEAPSRS